MVSAAHATSYGIPYHVANGYVPSTTAADAAICPSGGDTATSVSITTVDRPMGGGGESAADRSTDREPNHRGRGDQADGRLAMGELSKNDDSLPSNATTSPKRT